MGAKKTTPFRIITRDLEALESRRPVVESALYLGHNAAPHCGSKQSQKLGIGDLVVPPFFPLVVNNIAPPA